jgi:hypothetical protein
MGKSTILMFWVGGLVFTVISAFLLAQIPLQELLAPPSLQSPVMIPGLLVFAAGLANLIAWLGAIVLLIRLGAWGWLVVVVLLGGLAALVIPIFLIFGPDEFSADNDYGAYGEYGEYGEYSGPR